MFDFATTDLSLAIAHHLLIFLLAGVLAFEIGVIRPSMKREDVLRVASVGLGRVQDHNDLNSTRRRLVAHEPHW